MEEIIGIILNNWTGLKMSIEHGMGGNTHLVADKVSRMVDVVTKNLSGSNVSWENISDCLEAFMDDEFNTILEDGSTDEVAQVICEVFCVWREGDLNGLNAKIDRMPIKTPLQNKFKFPPVPQSHVEVQSDTAGNSYKVEETNDNEWTEVRRRR